MREEMIEALKKHAEGHIQKHKVNVEVLLQKTAGIAEHPDTLETNEVIWSKGLVTTIIIGDSEYLRIFFVTSLTIFALTSRRSILVIPGFLGSPAVITTTSLSEVSS